ncbi:MAG: hypothetical protein AAFR77_10355 [Cyanobacteria bacterium J06631_2]
MSITFLSKHLALVAVAGGIASAGMNTGIEALLNALIDQENLKVRETLIRSIIASSTVGLLLGIIYYAFALYGFPEKNMTPIQLISLFTTFFGLGNPLIGAAIKLFYSSFLAKDV